MAPSKYELLSYETSIKFFLNENKIKRSSQMIGKNQKFYL